ncbi:STN domain-containing protein, partial [Steroidobacter sp.]|uniref:STN domain-containing protein n=1 Tax=Steroidobacter sp. TaxID=1978227 RepID=UPI001A58CCE7
MKTAVRKYLVAATLLASMKLYAADPGSIDVPAGNLVAALKSLAAQVDVELVYQAEQLKNLRTEGVKGTLSPQEAIGILLKGTDLQVQTSPSGAMVIAPALNRTSQSVGSDA